MTNKTKYSLLFSLVISLFVFGQQQKDISGFTFKNNLFKDVSLNVNLIFKTLKIPYQMQPNRISVYNELTSLNDNYNLMDETYVYTNSNLFIENKFRGEKIDSFNPYGSSKMSSAIIIGVVNSIFKL